MTGERLRSLDVFRGATVAAMILVNNPGSWSHLYPPLAHAPWHGVTPTDLVFPFFLFAVGNAMVLTLPRWLAQGDVAFWGRVARRTALIFAIGLLLNWSPFLRWDAAGELVPRSWETLRLMGVLQRIALAFGAAAVILWWLRRREPGAVLWAVGALLLGYWAACLTFGDRADPYSLEGFFGTHWDRALLGTAHLYRGEGVPFDPEGLASTLPAVAQVLLGWWVGQAVAAARRIDERLLVRLFVHAAALLVLAYLWQLVMPLNKKLWTSSYVLFGGGCAAALLAVLLHGVEPRAAAGRIPAWARCCEWFGRNALFVFVLSGLVPRLLSLWRWEDGLAADGTPRWITPLPWLYRTVFADLGSDPRLGSLLFACANLAVYAAVAAWMDRRRWYVRV
ncbi:MAG: DUF5009 domain-containing protein [Rubrivivax sp.]|nr:DUF5009 domain-containing protein [Rubrivivax sp.]